jgi:glycosyltransferase involved in cell wall biosynthesis
MIVNPLMKDYYESEISRKIDVIPIPIRVSNFEFSDNSRDLIRRELGICKETKVVGYIGRFDPEKNLPTLIAAFADVSVQNPQALKLVLVGTGILESELKEYVLKRGIKDKVIFCGVRDDVGMVLASFDIFVLPSYTEGLSMALLEAMASSRAIICSDIPTNHQLVSHNKEGLLVNPHKPEELRVAIQVLFNDEALRSRLGQNARTKADQYDEEVIFPQMLKYYESLLAENIIVNR